MTYKKTSLYEEHLAEGGKMQPFAGYEMPIHYCSLKKEVLAVRQRCGVFDVSHMGEFWAFGPDAVDYVDYLICNDFAGAAIGKAVYSPLLREDGTIIDDLIAYKLGAEKILICVNAANIQKDWDWMKLKNEGFQVQLENKSDQFSLLAVQGPKAALILQEVGFPIDDDHILPSYSVTETQWQGETVIMARTGYTGEDGFEIFLSHRMAKVLWRKLRENGVWPCGLGARDVLRIEAGFPLYGQDIHDEVMPCDSGLRWTVKQEKNFFVGQNALKDYFPKYRFLKLTLDKGIPRFGHQVLNEVGDIVGQITSGTMSPILGKGIGLAHILREGPGWKKLIVKIRNKYYDAEPHRGPFVRRGKYSKLSSS